MYYIYSDDTMQTNASYILLLLTAKIIKCIKYVATLDCYIIVSK